MRDVVDQLDVPLAELYPLIQCPAHVPVRPDGNRWSVHPFYRAAKAGTLRTVKLAGVQYTHDAWVFEWMSGKGKPATNTRSLSKRQRAIERAEKELSAA